MVVDSRIYIQDVQHITMLRSRPSAESEMDDLSISINIQDTNPTPSYFYNIKI